MKRRYKSGVFASTWIKPINWGYIRSCCGCNMYMLAVSNMHVSNKKKELMEMESSEFNRYSVI